MTPLEPGAGMGRVTYAGKLTRCQAAVHEGGRSVGFRQCQLRPTVVVRVDWDPEGDHRLAVCGSHAKSKPFRYSLLGWERTIKAKPPSETPVEAEYQPSPLAVSR